MNSIHVDFQNTAACERCREYESDVQAYEILVLVLAFIGPVIGILIGLFAAKKLLSE
ncbi:MAG: hypothetical protein FWE32_03305 [Oscillospiraceae bacterium]|nr:hypothetical protein [Oscillospiraceae bacterium]